MLPAGARVAVQVDGDRAAHGTGGRVEGDHNLDRLGRGQLLVDGSLRGDAATEEPPEDVVRFGQASPFLPFGDARSKRRNVGCDGTPVNFSPFRMRTVARRPSPSARSSAARAIILADG